VFVEGTASLRTVGNDARDSVSPSVGEDAGAVWLRAASNGGGAASLSVGGKEAAASTDGPAATAYHNWVLDGLELGRFSEWARAAHTYVPKLGSVYYRALLGNILCVLQWICTGLQQ
jgi:hypothetical protein